MGKRRRKQKGFSAKGQKIESLEKQLERLDDMRYTLSVLQNIPLQYIDDYSNIDFIKIHEKYIEVNAKNKGKSFTRNAKDEEIQISKKIKEDLRKKYGK